MKRENKKDSLAAVYRQFSSESYNIYKRKYPRMKQADIVAKIIKQWEGMTTKDKQNLGEQYRSEGSSFPKGSGESIGTEKLKSSKKRSPSPKVLSDPLPRRDQESDYAKSSSKPKNSSNQISGSSSQQKRKIISKTKLEDFRVFQKDTYEKMSAKHPRWTSSQLNKIVKLLWTKRKIEVRRQRRQRKRSRDDSKRKPLLLSGYLAFKKDKLREGYVKEQIMSLWKKLPKEGKIYWTRIGRGLKSSSSRRLSTLIKLKNDNIDARKGRFGVGYMRQRIR